MNRKTTVAAAALAITLAQGVLAQGTSAPGPQLYGVLDAGVERVSNVGASGATVTRMPGLSGGQLPSRWGIRGTEDLGGGLRTVYTLESGFAADTGTQLQGGRAFGRQLFVGLAGDWGTLSFGRHWTMSFFSMLDADVIGPAVFGLAAFDPYLPNARADNSVAYRATFKGFTLGATYSLGRDGTPPSNCAGENAAGDCRAWSMLAKYDAPRWGVAMAHDKLKGGTAGGFFGQPSGTLASARNTDARTHLNGYLRVGAAKIGAGLVRRELRASPAPLSTDLRYLGVSAPVAGAFSIDAQWISLRDERPDANGRTIVVRGNYALSRRTSIYAMLGRVDNDASAAYSVTAGEVAQVAPLAGRGQTGLMLGLRHSF